MSKGIAAELPPRPHLRRVRLMERHALLDKSDGCPASPQGPARPPAGGMP